MKYVITEQLLRAILEYQEEHKVLKSMINMWENNNDSMSDPELQFEQVDLVEKLYNNIKSLAESL